MKSSILLCALIIIQLSALSQEICSDMIYTIENNGILFNCCIQEIVNENIVIFVKDGEKDSVAAYAVNRKGQYIELIRQPQPDLESNQPIEYDPDKYMGHSYEYYEDSFNTAKSKQGVGALFTIVGAGLMIGSFPVMASRAADWGSADGVGAAMLVGGMAMLGIGIPFLAVGSAKRAKSREAMQIILDQQKLSIRFNNYGVGICFKF